MEVRQQGPGSHPTWSGEKDVSLGYAAPQVGQRGGDVGPKLRARVGLQIGSSVGVTGLTSEESGRREEGRGQSRTEPEEERGREAERRAGRPCQERL